MLPQTQPRKKRNSSKVNLLISFIFHATLVLTLLYFAAREGLLGKQIQKISVEMIKEKPPEKPKEPEKPKVEPPKVEQPKIAATPKAEPPKEAPPAGGRAPDRRAAGGGIAVVCLRGRQGGGNQFRSRATLQKRGRIRLALEMEPARQPGRRQIMSPRWKSPWAATGNSAIRSGRRSPGTSFGTIRCGAPWPR